MPRVLIVGTLDTKGAEIGYVRDLIQGAGCATTVLDCGVMGEPAFAPEISSDEVAAAAGTTVAAIREAGDRGQAVTAMTAGVARLVAGLAEQGGVDGLISLGGSAGTTIGTSAMRALPVGVPKVMVSTLASGDTRPYVDARDICMMYSVVDIAGLNRISRRVFANAARAVAAMALGGEGPEPATDRPLVGATMFGVTTPCVTAVRERLEAAGYEVLVFHATGTGGQAMEGLVRDGLITGVVDVTTTEWCDELVGGVLSAGPERLNAAAEAGVPQVIVPGAMDMVNFGPLDSVPQQFRARRLYVHNPTVTLMRTTREECAELGRILAERAGRARGPTVVLLPLRGVSAIDQEGGPFHDAEADAALFEAVERHAPPALTVRRVEAHINDPEFAAVVADTFLELAAPAT